MSQAVQNRGDFSQMRCIVLILLAFIVLGCSFGGGGGAGGQMDSQIDHTPITTFRDNVLTIDATQFDGVRVRLNTQLDAESTSVYPPQIAGHAGRSWTLLQAGSEETFMGYAVLSWNREDPDDYLAAGWWIHFGNQIYPDIDPYSEDSTIYVFIDGPELDPALQTPLPAMGTASYSGRMGGQYLYKYGDAWGDVKGRISSEEFTGIMTLDVDFAGGSIRGCLGCVGDITVRRLHLTSAFERFETEPVELLADPKDYELRFAPTKFASDGTFETVEGVTVAHPERSGGEVHRGFWGGGFSNRRDAEGNPRLVVGFGSALFSEQDGSLAIISGIFNALSEGFQAANQ